MRSAVGTVSFVIATQEASQRFYPTTWSSTSPVVHTPQRGKSIVTLYLAAALKVFDAKTFRYVREIIGERDAVLEFALELDEIAIEGVDLIEWNDAGQIVAFKVMLRPLKALQRIQEKMVGIMVQIAGAPTAS